MAIISVEVPSSIAKKFKPYTIVKYKTLLQHKSLEEELLAIDGDGWIDYEVNMEATDFLKTLKKEVLDLKK